MTISNVFSIIYSFPPPQEIFSFKYMPVKVQIRNESTLDGSNKETTMVKDIYLWVCTLRNYTGLGR